VFEQRNHAYGAFDLRRSYEKHILGGFVITISVLLLITGGALIRTILGSHPLTPKTREMPDALPPHVFDLPKEKEAFEKPDARQKPPAGSSEKVKSTVMLVVNTDSMKVDDQKAPDTLALNSTSTKEPNGSAKTGGSGGTGVDSSLVTGGQSGGDSKLTYTDFPETWPEFPGGQEALFRFLRKNLRYPRSLHQEQGTVHAAFVIQADGTIGEVSILKGINAQFDQEVIRVIQKMPNWNPGKQGSDKVAVRYKLPVKFTFQE
jgi:protein TonB